MVTMNTSEANKIILELRGEKMLKLTDKINFCKNEVEYESAKDIGCEVIRFIHKVEPDNIRIALQSAEMAYNSLLIEYLEHREKNK